MVTIGLPAIGINDIVRLWRLDLAHQVGGIDKPWIEVTGVTRMEAVEKIIEYMRTPTFTVGRDVQTHEIIAEVKDITYVDTHGIDPKRSDPIFANRPYKWRIRLTSGDPKEEEQTIFLWGKSYDDVFFTLMRASKRPNIKVQSSISPADIILIPIFEQRADRCIKCFYFDNIFLRCRYTSTPIPTTGGKTCLYGW